MRNEEEFRALVKEKATAYETARRIRRRHFRNAFLLCSLCFAIGLSTLTIAPFLRASGSKADSFYHEGNVEATSPGSSTDLLPGNQSSYPLQNNIGQITGNPIDDPTGDREFSETIGHVPTPGASSTPWVNDTETPKCTLPMITIPETTAATAVCDTYHYCFSDNLSDMPEQDAVLAKNSEEFALLIQNCPPYVQNDLNAHISDATFETDDVLVVWSAEENDLLLQNVMATEDDTVTITFRVISLASPETNPCTSVRQVFVIVVNSKQCTKIVVNREVVPANVSSTSQSVSVIETRETISPESLPPLEKEDFPAISPGTHLDAVVAIVETPAAPSTQLFKSYETLKAFALSLPDKGLSILILERFNEQFFLAGDVLLLRAATSDILSFRSVEETEAGMLRVVPALIPLPGSDIICDQILILSIGTKEFSGAFLQQP